MTDPSSSNADPAPPPPPTGDDPSNFVTSPPSTHVKIINTARADLNGLIGLVVGHNSDRGRYNVSLLPGQQGGGGGGGTARAQAAADAAAARAAGGGGGGRSPPGAGASMSFKPDNLVRATRMEHLKVRANLAKIKMMQYANDPEIREQFRRLYTTVDRRLPAQVKPEHAALAAFLLWFILARMIGLSKAVMLTSTVMLLASIAAPDLLGGADVRTAARNFPRRWREAIVQSTGWGWITEKQALIGLAVIVVLTLKLLLTPVGGGGAGAAAAVGATASMGGPDGGSAIPPVVPHQQPRSTFKPPFDIEEIYKLGYDDAKEGEEFGTSLPDLTAETAPRGLAGEHHQPGTGGPELPDGPIDWPYDPQPAQTRSESKFGFAFMMAGFTLFRFVKELAMNPDGRFDQQFFLANLKAQPPWKFAIIGFAVYKILSAFL